MNFAYFDESGDDGYPGNTRFFIMTSLVCHESDWRFIKNRFLDLRTYLSKEYGFPIKFEMHTHQFLLNKNPFRDLGLNAAQRLEIVTLHCKLLISLPLWFVNVCIDKENVKAKTYDVLHNAFAYNIQRIRNTLANPTTNKNNDNNFLIITDKGRVGKMRKTARKMERDNQIPSKIHSGSYQQPIDTIIEDVLEKDSKESYFVQAADLVGYLVSLYVKDKCPPKVGWTKRMRDVIAYGDEEKLLELLSPVLNTAASQNAPYGIVYYPKP